MPFFSILMPSRNRSQLLTTSIETVIQQSFQDYELIVSDNNSRDDTKQLVERAASGRPQVRYVNPGRDLSMCDNFEYALDHATGEYIILLSDDDGLVAGMLKFVHSILTCSRTRNGEPIEVLAWQRGRYSHPDLKEAGDPGSMFLAFRLRSGQLYEVTSKLMLDVLSAFDNTHPNYHFAVPKILNCAVSRGAYERCKKVTGRFFVPPYPDYTAICQLLCTHPVYHIVDMPLYVCGSSIAANSVISYKRKEKVNTYFSLFQPGEIDLHSVPYPMEYLTATYLMATYLQFQKIYPDTYRSQVSIPNYLDSLAIELIGYEQSGEDVQEEMKQLAGYMRDYYGTDKRLEQLRSIHRSNQATGRFLTTLRTLAATNAMTRAATSGVMRLAHRKASDARQYRKVHSIIEASRIVSRDLRLDERRAESIQPAEIADADTLTLLA